MMGRPTKYDPSMIQKIEEYVRSCGREQTKLPKRVDVALLLDVDDDTLVEWEKKYPDFSATIKKVDQLQKGELIDDGLFGGKEINAAMAIFLLKANHNMMETEKRILAGDEDSPVKIDVSSALEKVYGIDQPSDDKMLTGSEG